MLLMDRFGRTRQGCSGLRVQTSTEPGPMAEAAATLSSRRQRGGVPHGARFTLGRSIHRGTGSFLVAHQPLLSTGTRMSGVFRRGMNTFPCRRVCASVDARGGWQGGTFLPEIRKVSRETKKSHTFVISVPNVSPVHGSYLLSCRMGGTFSALRAWAAAIHAHTLPLAPPFRASDAHETALAHPGPQGRWCQLALGRLSGPSRVCALQLSTRNGREVIDRAYRGDEFSEPVAIVAVVIGRGEYVCRGIQTVTKPPHRPFNQPRKYRLGLLASQPFGQRAIYLIVWYPHAEWDQDEPIPQRLSTVVHRRPVIGREPDRV